MRRRLRRHHQVDLFETSLASGIGQALAGWAAEYTHSLLERDPELRARLRENWMFMYRRIAQGMSESNKSAKRRARRRQL